MRVFHRFKHLVFAALLFGGGLTGSCFAQTCKIAIEAATATNNGIVEIPGPQGVTAFALSTSNEGSTCGVNVTATASGPNGGAVPVTITLCQTNPQNASCFNPSQPASFVSLEDFAGEQPTFSVFVQGHGVVPAGSEVCVYFFAATSGVVAPQTFSLCLPLETI
jgi:hypothetical protein